MDRPGKVLSGERDGIYVNQAEELTLEDWETLTTRTTGRGAVTDVPMLFGDCNPGPPSHWILNRPSLDVLSSSHEDNPTLYDAAGQITDQGRRSMAILDALSGSARSPSRAWGNATRRRLRTMMRKIGPRCGSVASRHEQRSRMWAVVSRPCRSD
jgi:phage terminase large subunit